MQEALPPLPAGFDRVPNAPVENKLLQVAGGSGDSADGLPPLPPLPALPELPPAYLLPDNQNQQSFMQNLQQVPLAPQYPQQMPTMMAPLPQQSALPVLTALPQTAQFVQAPPQQALKVPPVPVQKP